MKKTVKRVLVIAGLVLAAAVIPLVIRIATVVRTMHAMTSIETSEVVPDVFAVRERYVNLFLVRGPSGVIAFDAGINPDSVRNQMKKLGLDPVDVRAVFLTHGDADHAGGLAAFPNAAVYLGDQEEQMIDGRTARFLFIRNKPIGNHGRIRDNETVEAAGLKVTAIHTPGHTPGAVCYLADGGLLFTGDTMRLTNGKAGIFSRAINMDSKTQEKSLRRLAGLTGVRAVFTGHFGYTEDFEGAMAEFRK
ncbi:MAG: MBL fold metallo-hydrolase [bacterium]|nr:MBL fold metallo-hydrolase [bacterium]